MKYMGGCRDRSGIHDGNTGNQRSQPHALVCVGRLPADTIGPRPEYLPEVSAAFTHDALNITGGSRKCYATDKDSLGGIVYDLRVRVILEDHVGASVVLAIDSPAECI